MGACPQNRDILMGAHSGQYPGLGKNRIQGMGLCLVTMSHSLQSLLGSPNVLKLNPYGVMANSLPILSVEASQL